MRFNRHFDLEGHAVLSPSSPHWLRYDEDKLDRVYTEKLNAARGDRLHQLAADLIREGVKLPDAEKTLNMYVNDAIGFRMWPEQKLYYSDFVWGTCDAIAFTNNTLRIHDLKTGKTVTKIEQLEVYAALFCLEYMYKPFDIDIILAIYQSNRIDAIEGDPDVIFRIMNKIVNFSRRLKERQKEDFR